MDFELSEEHRAYADSVARFAREQLSAGALERAHSPHYPWETAALLARQGLLGIAFPEADGGQGGTLMHAVLAIQEVALVCPKSADIVQVGNFGPMRTFVEYATPEQKARFLPALLAGTKLISLGMSEPDAGSAVTELKTTARLDGDHYVINGSKVFSTHSPEADLFLVYVRFGPGLQGIGSVLVERGTPGFEVGRETTFMNGEQWGPLYFENCRIPAANLLLGAGGFKKQISGFNVERLGNASRALALGRYCFNLAREHALVRKQFGRELCEFQGIQWKFADMAMKLEQAQLHAVPRRAGGRARIAVGTKHGDGQAGLQPGGLGRFQRGAPGHGRGRFQPGLAGRILRAAHPRLDDCRRVHRDPEEPNRRRCVPADVLATPAQGAVNAMDDDAQRRGAGAGAVAAAQRRAGRCLRRHRRKRRHGRCSSCGRCGLRRCRLSDQSAARDWCRASAPGRTWPRLPEVPEHVFVMTATEHVLDTVRECARLGVKVATVLASGFSESGPEGIAREAALREIARTSRVARARSQQPGRRPSVFRPAAHRECRLRRTRVAHRKGLRRIAQRQHDRLRCSRAARRAASASPGWCRSAARSI